MGMAVGESGSRPDINVTPLIDVCLVLLVIFMVVTPMLQKGRPVELPRTDNPEKKPDAENTKIVSIDKDGNLFIEQDLFGKEQFLAHLRDEKERIPALEIQLKGDRRLEYGKVLEVMKALNEADVHGVALVTEKIETQGF